MSLFQSEVVVREEDGRYQQLRAVHGAIDRLLHGKTRAQDGREALREVGRGLW